MEFEKYRQIIKRGGNLHRLQAKVFLGSVIDDEDISDSTIAEILFDLTKSKLDAEQICGFVDAMKLRMTNIKSQAGTLDTCGTGGDGLDTFNISTAAAILLSASGVKVAKHGNRAASGLCGSADVLEALGIPIDLNAVSAAIQLTNYDFAFLFAPQYHQSLKRLSIIRKSLGFPTVFNLLGPLLNPAAVKYQVVGTYSESNAKLLSSVMARLGYKHAIVLTSGDGLDEASLGAPVHIYDIRGTKIRESYISAKDVGLSSAHVTSIKGGDAFYNAKLITELMKPGIELSPNQSVVVFNAGIGLYVSGRTKTIDEGVNMAKASLESGLGNAKLSQLKNLR
jgi:anthranilate phosphoribosyltransferase